MGFPQDRILLIPMSINIDKVPKFPIEAIPENTFGYFGALEPWQGPDLLVTSFGLLLKKIPQAKLYIIGEGSMKKSIEEQILRDRFSSNIILVNSIPREMIWNEYFAKFRILVIPRPRMNNSIDSLPSIKLIEALAAGKVIIATDIPSMRELPSDSILLVPPGDALSLARAMESMSLDSVRLEEYSRAALTSANNHDIKVNIKKLIRVMENHEG
jgi:glycosyltransferase involved in cell wall biosynthesis